MLMVRAVVLSSLGALFVAGCSGKMMDAMSSSPAQCVADAKHAFTDCFPSSGMAPEPATIEFLPGNKSTARPNHSTCAAGYADGDDLPDLACYSYKNPLRVYRNLGHMQFKDTTAESGLPASTMVFGAVWGDLDHDGCQDLVFAPITDAIRMLTLQSFAGNVPMPPIPNSISVFRSTCDGTGKFMDVSAAWGFGDSMSSELTYPRSFSLYDLNNDGRLDVFEVREGLTSKNYGRVFAHISQPDGKWVEQGIDVFGMAGGWPWGQLWTHVGTKPALALLNDPNPDGGMARPPSRLLACSPRMDGVVRCLDEVKVPGIFGDGNVSAMGATTIDTDGNGCLDVYVTDIGLQHYLSCKSGAWTDVALMNGSAVRFNRGLNQSSSGHFVGFAPTFLDLDAGALGLFITGSTDEGNTSPPYTAFLSRTAGGQFTDMSDMVLASNLRQHSSEGVAAADFDADGETDLLLAATGSPPQLLWNHLAPGSNWLSIRLKGHRSNSDGIGALVTVTVSGQPPRTREMYPGGASVGWSEPRLSFALGAQKSAQVKVAWPSGTNQMVTLSAGRATIEEQ